MIRLITLDSHDPAFNLATEEYLFSQNDDAVLLWQNYNAVIIGRNQNTLAEINKEVIDKYGISVVRRITGGGAVFHDRGNVNYSVITTESESGSINFAKYLTPVINALLDLGIHAEFSGRNDILVNGFKISGNAQHISDRRVLHHGTLLFSSDLDMMSKVLNVSKEKIRSKAVSSVRSRVANIKDFLPESEAVTTEDFMGVLKRYYIENLGCVLSKLSEKELSEAEALANSKYRTWQWNYGNSPKYTFSSSAYLSCGTVEIRLEIIDGKISDAAVYGDFFSVKPKEEFVSAIRGVEHSESALLSVFKKINVADYFIGVKENELIRLFF